jgi:hypothetical protein
MFDRSQLLLAGTPGSGSGICTVSDANKKHGLRLQRSTGKFAKPRANFE